MKLLLVAFFGGFELDTAETDHLLVTRFDVLVAAGAHDNGRAHRHYWFGHPFHTRIVERAFAPSGMPSWRGVSSKTTIAAILMDS